jgi:hypothetical protein
VMMSDEVSGPARLLIDDLLTANGVGGSSRLVHQLVSGVRGFSLALESGPPVHQADDWRKPPIGFPNGWEPFWELDQPSRAGRPRTRHSGWMASTPELSTLWTGSDPR